MKNIASSAFLYSLAIISILGFASIIGNTWFNFDPIPENKCAWYQDSHNSIEKDYGAFYWRAMVPFVEPVETPVSGCKTNGWIYMLIAGTFIITVVVLILKIPKGSKKR